MYLVHGTLRNGKQEMVIRPVKGGQSYSRVYAVELYTSKL